MTEEDLFATLTGRTLDRIEHIGEPTHELRFYVSDGTVYRMCHFQDCCETVELIDTAGDFDDLIGTPILLAEAVSYDWADVPELIHPPAIQQRSYVPESATWTFYKLATIKGSVTLRWLGESNGYYSERANFEELRR